MYKKLTTLILILLCSTLYVSAQSSTYTHGTFTSQEKKQKEKILKVYPVPATTQIHFQLQHSNNEGSFEIIVYNFLGKTVDKITGFQGQKTLSLKDYYSGIYIYQLRDNKGRLIESGKFNVVKQ